MGCAATQPYRENKTCRHGNPLEVRGKLKLAIEFGIEIEPAGDLGAEARGGDPQPFRPHRKPATGINERSLDHSSVAAHKAALHVRVHSWYGDKDETNWPLYFIASNFMRFRIISFVSKTE